MTNITQVLKGSTDVTDITTEIHYGHAPQHVQVPLVVYSIISRNPENGFDGVICEGRTRWSVQCFGKDQQQSGELFQACYDALKNIANIPVVNAYAELDPSNEGYQSQFDVSIWT